MFGKTKRRIVFAVVFSLVALMVVTLTTIYLSNRLELDRESGEMLRAFAGEYTLGEEPGRPEGEMRPEGRPEDMGEPPRLRPDRQEREFRLSTFYSAAFSKDGELIEVRSGNSELLGEQSLAEEAASILASGRRSGRAGNMTYLVDERVDYTLVAMIDTTISDRNLVLLLREMLIIGSLALAVLVAISVLIARRIVRPLEENDSRQKRFVQDAGHELKTPIAVISANTELLRRQTGESEWLDNIEYENGRMSELVRQLLALSKAENGAPQKETLDFSKLVEGELLPFEALAFEKGTRTEAGVEPGLFVSGNPGQLRQLVSILLDNALSHGTGDEISLTLRRERHSAVLTVTNDSEPIDRERLAHLFDRFYRADEARSGSESHYGLGLSIAQAVTEAHGGDIRAEFENGRAAFTVTLPLKK